MKITLQEEILQFNEGQAEVNRKLFAEKNVFVFNFISSPGSGKTTFLCKLIECMSENYRIAVVEGDLYTAKDALRIQQVCPAVTQINTSGACHIEADTISKAIEEFDLDNIDILFIENVGNLVCPAEFDLGEDEIVTILSVTEGDDKPEKYPFTFSKSATAIINKVDLLPYTNFRMDYAREQILKINPATEIFEISTPAMSGYEALEAHFAAKVNTKLGK